MARDESDWKRRREREDEADAEEAERLAKKGISSTRPGAQNLDAVVSKPEAEKFDEILLRAEPLVEQLNNLYHMYQVGVERLPPTERRKQLDAVMLQLQLMPKLTPSAQFKYNSVFSRYQTYKEKWDKLMKDIESGKVQRKPK